jgi:hypothetical protein
MENREINELSKEELLPLMEKLISQGWKVFVKWHCPCGERATVDEPNCFYLEGFIHTLKEDGLTRCGKISHPDKFGLLAIKEKK